MKFDTIIIGGGLAALTAGIRLLEEGRKVAAVSAGQSALHFCSGSFELLGTGKPDDNPLDRIDTLPGTHPYRLMGRTRLEEMLGQVRPLMERAGVRFRGEARRNHWRLTPLGFLKPAWLTLADHPAFEDPDRIPWKRVAIINVSGYIDFYPRFLQAGLEKRGAETVTASYTTPEITYLRRSSSEMRSSNIARVMSEKGIDDMARELNEKSKGCDAILTPAVLGLYGNGPVEALRSKVDKPVWFVPTIPANVPGVRTQLQLRERFQQLGGYYYLGDTARRGEFESGRLRKIYTANLGEMPLEADTFIAATGSFFSYGIVADMEHVYEPVLGLDLNVPEGGRTEWYDKDLYARQPYMDFGVVTDSELHPTVKGRRIENLFAAGALLGGFNALKEQSGAGITTSTALHAANLILEKF